MSAQAEQSLSTLALTGLICIPLFPLLLFGFGARPPDTSNLPVTTDQLWATGGIVAATGVVVLGCLFVPGGLAGVGSWIAGPPDVVPKLERAARAGSRGTTRGGRPYQHHRLYSPRYPSGLAADARQLPRGVQPTLLSYAQQKEAYHLARLRATPLILPFSEHGKQSAPIFLLSALFSLFLLVIIFGQLVKKGYVVDASVPPPRERTDDQKTTKKSVEEEFQDREKRKTANEKPEETAKRRAKEKSMWDKRRKEEAAFKPKVASLTVQQMYDGSEKKKTAGETPEETAKRREKEKPKWDERFKREKEKAEEAKKKKKDKGAEEPKEAAKTNADPEAKATKVGKVTQALKKRWTSFTGSL